MATASTPDENTSGGRNTCRIASSVVTIATLRDAAPSHAPDRLALVGRHGRFTASELEGAVRRAANALRSLGVEQGDRVAAALPNDVDIVIAFLGAMRLGAIWVGLNRP